jgi:3-deoxy-D-manno-octulosonate 8-phosphate phosphatase (KDO 8-P phosphatase)
MIEIDEKLRPRILPLKLMIFDVDGVLTDGRMIFHDDGSLTKIFDVKDGHGIKLLKRAGIEVALVSGSYSKALEHRARNLGLDKVFQGVKVKLEAYGDIISHTGLKDREIGCMGDDLIDIPVMRRAGFAVAVPDASPHVFPYAHYVTHARGGHGAAREVCELILKVQGHWDRITERYFGSIGE